MRNARRRREILVFAVLLSSSTDVLEKNAFRTLYNAVYRFIEPIDKAYVSYEPDGKKRKAEVDKIRLVVNPLLPNNWANSPDEWKLWFVLQLAYRMVASGWQVPTDPLLADFVQALFQVSQQYNISNPPPASWTTAVATAPEKLRKQGLYK